jgi:hypothetical protein
MLSYEKEIGKDVEGSCCILILAIISAFFWMY